MDVSVPEVQQATQESSQVLRECFSILDNNLFTSENGKDGFGTELVAISDLNSGWPVWVDVKNFCKITGIDIAQVIINLDFSIFDD